jgi:hypothetical protein
MWNKHTDVIEMNYRRSVNLKRRRFDLTHTHTIVECLHIRFMLR